MLRPISIKHYLSIMRTKGFQDANLVAGTAIDPSTLEHPDYLISHEDHHAFVQNMVRLQGDCGLGLELGLMSEAPHFGILAYAGLSCRTIRHGMQDVWSRYGNAFGVATRLTVITEDDQVAVVEISAPQVNEAIYRFSIEEALCVLLKIGAPLTDNLAPFSALMLSYPKPGYGDRYQDIFNCPITFQAPFTRVTINRSWLDSPLKTRDVELNRICLDHLDRVLKQTETASPISLRLRHLLLSRIGTMPSSTEAAKTLGLSSRTLMRQLQKQGYTYRRLTEEVRIKLAQSWLNSGRVSAKEVSHRLGFSDVATFRRAFKNWTGMTVSQHCATLKKPH